MVSMSDKIDVDAIHRQFGAELFNHTWALIEKPARSAADDAEMVLSAMTSRWHWGRIGGPPQVITGDWQVAHVLALVGDAALSLRFATRALDGAIAAGFTGWRLASVHEGMARAHAAAGDAAARAEHVAAAEAALAAETDAKDATVIADQLASVPPA
jgi:hypothetical protein